MSGLRSANPNIKVIAGDSFEGADAKVVEYRRKWRDNPAGRIVERFPVHLDIESTSICNLKCPFCAGTYEKYEYGHMPIERFRRIIDEGADKGLCSAKLNFRGEPLLQPRIDEMVAYAKGRGLVDVFFNTNATKLSGDMPERLLDSGLDRLIISFEGYTAEIYEKNRVGANFDAVLANVRAFAELKRRKGLRSPVLRLQTVALPLGDDYIDKYRAFWRDWADEITCIDLRDEQGDYSRLQKNGWICPYPWLRLCITWDGNILTCPFMNRSLDKYEWRGFGNVDQTQIESAWTSPAMDRVREAHINGVQHSVEPCRHCSYRGTELSKMDKEGGFGG